MESFTDALKQGNLEKIRAFPKSDLHNHFILGGSRQYLHKMTGIKIEPVKTPILSMDEMHAWNRENLGKRFETSEMRKLLIRATLHQAREDGVTVLEIGEDVWGLSEYIGSVACYGSEIDDLIVNKKYQNKGYGKQLLLWGMNHIRQISNGPILLHVAKWNEKALKLYEKVGFNITNTERVR